MMTDFPYEHIMKATFRVEAARKGTAFLVGAQNRHLLTALHVIGQVTDKITVEIDGKAVVAKLKQRFQEIDVALLELEDPINASPLELTNSSPESQKFKIYGFPIDSSANWYDGQISGPVKDLKSKYEIRFDQEQHTSLQGLSGAPVLDLDTGEVLGIITDQMTDSMTLAKMTSSAGFAASIKYVDVDALLDIYVIMSETDRKAANNDGVTLRKVVNQSLKAIEDSEIYKTKKYQGINVHEVYASDVVKNFEALKEAIIYLCSDEIVVFDVTNNEPIIMFLMGIRSVVRRGITICSVGGEFKIGDVIDFPFNVKEVSFMSHSKLQYDQPEVPPILLATRVKEGLSQSDYKQYLDMPAFDGVRNLFPEGRSSVPIEERILLLCSYSPRYQSKNLRHVQTGLRLYAKQTTRIERILDLSSPRLISATTFEALRRTTLTIVDLTEWRANVMFELGVRASVNQGETGTICIIEDKDREFLENIIANSDIEQLLKDHLEVDDTDPWFEKMKRRYQIIAQQCLDFLKLFVNFKYERTPGAFDVFATLMKYQADKVLINDTNQVTFSVVYNTISMNYDERAESFARPIYEQLDKEAEMLGTNSQSGNTSLIYPNNSRLREMSEQAITERYLAAWSYIDVRYDRSEIRKDSKLKNAYEDMGYKLTARLHDGPLYDKIKSALDKFAQPTREFAMPDEVQEEYDFFKEIDIRLSKAKTSRNEEHYPEAITITEGVIKDLLEKYTTGNEVDTQKAKTYLSETYGSLGGIYNRNNQFHEAGDSYKAGEDYDEKTFNKTNRIINYILANPQNLIHLRADIFSAIQTLNKETDSSRENDFWAWADLGVLSILYRDNTRADKAYKVFTNLAPPDYAYGTHLRVLKQLVDALVNSDFQDIAEKLKGIYVELEEALDKLKEPSS